MKTPTRPQDNNPRSEGTLQSLLSSLRRLVCQFPPPFFTSFSVLIVLPKMSASASSQSSLHFVRYHPSAAAPSHSSQTKPQWNRTNCFLRRDSEQNTADHHNAGRPKGRRRDKQTGNYGQCSDGAGSGKVEEGVP